MADFDHSPPKPWTPGRQTTYTAYTLVVHVCEDEHGRVWSDHEFFTEGDALVAAGTRNGGVEQVAHAMLTEALRREAFVDLLVKISHDPALLGRLQQPAQREALATEIEGVVTRVITQVLPKALPGLVRGVLDMIVASKG